MAYELGRSSDRAPPRRNVGAERRGADNPKDVEGRGGEQGVAASEEPESQCHTSFDTRAQEIPCHRAKRTVILEPFASLPTERAWNDGPPGWSASSTTRR
jgi:hypothetical protein